jgi:NAD(P)H-dependent FMN reductase
MSRSPLRGHQRVLFSGGKNGAITMSVLPSRLDPRWRDVALGKLGGNWHMLAVKLMMQRIRSEMQADPSPGNVAKCAGAVHDFFEKNQKIAGADLAEIFH